MTYDHWKTADDTPGDDKPEERDELEAVYEQLYSLRDSHAELLAAAKNATRVLQKLQPHVHMDVAEALQAAIAKAEELP